MPTKQNEKAVPVEGLKIREGTNKEQVFFKKRLLLVKFIYSEKASTYSQKKGEDFAKFCGLLRIYEL